MQTIMKKAKFEEIKNHLNIVEVLLISLGEVEENELESVETDLLTVMPAGVSKVEMILSGG